MFLSMLISVLLNFLNFFEIIPEFYDLKLNRPYFPQVPYNVPYAYKIYRQLPVNNFPMDRLWNSLYTHHFEIIKLYLKKFHLMGFGVTK